MGSTSPPVRNAPPLLVAPAGGRDSKAKPAHLSVEVLIREAHKVMADLDIQVGNRRLHRVVRRFIREGRNDLAFRTWFLGYADPTGEAAVRNVLEAKEEASQ